MEAIAAVGLTANVLKIGFDIYNIAKSSVEREKIRATTDAKDKLSGIEVWDIWVCRGCKKYVAHTMSGQMHVFWSPERAAVAVHLKVFSCPICCFNDNTPAGTLKQYTPRKLYTGEMVSLRVARWNLDVLNMPITSATLGRALFYHWCLMQTIASYYHMVMERNMTTVVGAAQYPLCILNHLKAHMDSERVADGSITREVAMFVRADELAQRWEKLLGTDGTINEDDNYKILIDETDKFLGCETSDAVKKLMGSARYYHSLWDYMSYNIPTTLDPITSIIMDKNEMVHILQEHADTKMDIGSALSKYRQCIDIMATHIRIEQVHGNNYTPILNTYAFPRFTTNGPVHGILQVSLNSRFSIIYRKRQQQDCVWIDGIQLPTTFTDTTTNIQHFRNTCVKLYIQRVADGELELLLSLPDDSKQQKVVTQALGRVIPLQRLSLSDMLVPAPCCNGRYITAWSTVADEKRPQSNSWMALGPRAWSDTPDAIQRQRNATCVAILPGPMNDLFLHAGFAHVAEGEFIGANTHIDATKVSEPFCYSVEAPIASWLDTYLYG